MVTGQRHDAFSRSAGSSVTRQAKASHSAERTQTQDKIERWHQTLKNRLLLENYFLPGELKAQIEAFVDHYNHQHYHESLNNVTPADIYFGRAKAILKQRERIKRKTLETRRLHHHRQHVA